MKTKILIAVIILATALLNWVPAIGQFIMSKTSDRIPLDSVLHAVYYFSIGTIIVNIPWLKKKNLFLTLLVLFFFSLSIETVQAFIPGRTFSFADIACNFLGIAVAYLLQRIIRKPRSQIA